MRILFEEYQYKTEDVTGILGDFILSKLDMQSPTQSLRYVGYFYNKDINLSDGSLGDLVFILPKVLVDKDGKVFGCRPEDLINFNWEEWKNDSQAAEGCELTRRQVYDFIYGFAVWVYRAVDIYRRNQKDGPDDEEAKVMTSVRMGSSGRKENATWVDIMLSLLDFQRDHSNFITFVMRTNHSGLNKINWTKTIAKSQAFIQDGVPIYLNPLNKKRVVNFDEELLVIFYSILSYMHREYGFAKVDQPGYEVIKGAKFDSYLNGLGKAKLRRIRNKYFSDEAVLLWNLCYAFFDKSDSMKVSSHKEDYLLVNSFHYVFEEMVDDLVGDKNLPAGLKEQRDDKRIDHLYTYRYLIENVDESQGTKWDKKIYNIADSKYYNRDKGLRGHDVPKQFTYARNVTQWHMDLLNGVMKDCNYKEIPLFDEVTEGYNIIPNFFVSAMVDKDLGYDHDELKLSSLDGGGHVQESYFFWERLFDRSSLFTMHFDVNFLFVLKKYAKDRKGEQSAWRADVRKRFREEILAYLNEEYVFYQILVAPEWIPDFVNRHYRKLQGMVFSLKDVGGKRVLIYAERTGYKDSTSGPGLFSFDEKKHVYVNDQSELVIPGAKPEIVKVKNVKLGESGYDEVRPSNPQGHQMRLFGDVANQDSLAAGGTDYVDTD